MPIDLATVRAQELNIIVPVVFEEKLQEYVDNYKEFVPTWDPPFDDPLYLMFRTAAYVKSVQSHDTNGQFRAGSIAWATGERLARRGLRYGLIQGANESDDDFRNRTIEAPYAVTAPGTPAGIMYHARNAHTDVIDTDSVATINDQDVTVYILSGGDPPPGSKQGTPTAIMLAEITTYLAHDERHLIGSISTAVVPTFVDWTIVTSPTYDSSRLSDVAAEGAVRIALEAFIDATVKFGIAIDLANLITIIRSIDGIINVTITTPSSDLDSAAGRIYSINKDETDVEITMVAA